MDKDAEDGCEEQRGRKAMSDTSAIRQEPRAVQRPWLASYPQGIPVELPDLGYTSLAELLNEAASSSPIARLFPVWESPSPIANLKSRRAPLAAGCKASACKRAIASR